MFRRLPEAAARRSPSRSDGKSRRRSPGDTVRPRSCRRCRSCRTDTGGPCRAAHLLHDGVCFECLVTIDGVGNAKPVLFRARRHARRNAKAAPRHRGGNASMIRDVETLPANVDSGIVGPGPAGLAASATAGAARPERPDAGRKSECRRQIYRAITTKPAKDHALLGKDYGAASLGEGGRCLSRSTPPVHRWSVGPTGRRRLRARGGRSPGSRLITAREVMLADRRTRAGRFQFPVDAAGRHELRRRADRAQGFGPGAGRPPS